VLIGVFIAAIIVFMILQDQVEKKKAEENKEVKTEDGIDFDHIKVPTQNPRNPGPGGPYGGSPMRGITQAEMAETKSKMMQINVAVAQYVAENNTLPYSIETALDGLDIPRNYLIDAWGNKFRLNDKGNMGFSISSAGPDRVWGSPDDMEVGN
jgi:hypothetical protein